MCPAGSISPPGGTGRPWPTTRRPCSRPPISKSAGNTAPRKGEVSYWIGTVYEALGDLDKARASWREAVELPPRPSRLPVGAGEGDEVDVVGVAGAAVCRPANSVGEALWVAWPPACVSLRRVSTIRPWLSRNSGTPIVPRFSSGSLSTPAPRPSPRSPIRRLVLMSLSHSELQVADARCLVGLGYLGLNEKDQARQEFSLALQVSPDHWAAQTALAQMGSGPSPTR